MSDVARLGLAIDSSQAVAAKKALDDLSAAARPASAAASGLEKAIASAKAALADFKNKGKDAETALDGIGKSSKQSATYLEGFAKALDGAVGSVRDMASVGQRGLDELRAKFDPLFAAGQRYKQTLGDIRDAHRAGALSENQMARAIMDTKVAFTAQVNALNGLDHSFDHVSESTNTFAKSGALARHELINLSRQIQDVFVSLVSGQSPFTVIAQQGAQVVDIYGSSKTGTVGGSLKQIGQWVTGLVTPMRLLGVGVAASGIAAYAAYNNWKTYTLQLDDAARSAGTTTQSLSALQAAASFKGIAGDDFNKGIANFGRGVYDAKNNMGALADVFRANNVHARDFDDALEKAANLIQNARSDQQRLVLLQQMGLPPTMEWVRLLSGGADGLNKAKAAAAEFAANDNLIQKAREFDEAWNKAWTNFGLNARSAFQSALSAGSTFFDKMANLARDAGNSSFWNRFITPEGMKAAGVDAVSPFDQRFGSPTSSGNTALQDDIRRRAASLRGDSTVDPNALKNQIALEQQRLGILGQTATVQQQVRAVELQVQSARLNGVRITESEEAALKRLAAAQALGITQIQGATDAMRVEAATVGMSVGDATAYAAAQNAINEARRAGRELTPDNIAQIKREAAALGEAAAQADNLRWQYENLVRGPLQTFTSAIANGATAWEAFKKAGQSALNSIASKLADMAAQNLWNAAFGGSSGGGFGGLLSGLFGGGGNSAPTWSTGLGAGTGGLAFPTFDSGGFTGMGGKYEPAGIVHKGEYVFDAASTRRIGVGNLERLRGYAEGGIVDSMPRLSMPGRASNDNGGGSSQNIHVTVGVTVDNDGNLQAYVKNVAQTESQKSVTGFVRSPAFTEHVAVANVKAKTQRLGR